MGKKEGRRDGGERGKEGGRRKVEGEGGRERE